ncbi:MAG: hypothetical protein LBS97_02270 [Treponema sp.]|jgi:hypothetical protein|nr:hypothetical protein [Treponema sp.]
MMNESLLERALQSTWEAKERFYEENKGLTIRQILEKLEGRHANFTGSQRAPSIRSEGLVKVAGQ